MLEVVPSKLSLGSLGCVGRGEEQAFTRGFGYMLGARRSKSSLGSWMENFVLPRMPVFSCIGRAKQAFTRGGASVLLGVRQKTLCCRSFIYQ